MRVGLICPDNLKAVLTELLTARNITVDAQSGIFIVEASCRIPEDKVSIRFDMNRIDLLVELLDRLSRVSEEGGDSVVGKIDDRFEIIPYKQVLFFEGRGNYVFCITPNNEFKVKDKLYELESKLPRNRFIRVNKSFIVNISNVSEIIPWFDRRMLLKFCGCKSEVEVSKNYIRSFKEFIGL
jgi:two-component system LytT family response regulator